MQMAFPITATGVYLLQYMGGSFKAAILFLQMSLLNVREHLYFYPLVCPKQREKLPHVISANTEDV